MKSSIAKEIITLVLLLWLQPVVARGRPILCSPTRNFVIIYPHDSGAKPGCRPCPECPVGQGLSPQCGSQITNGTKIECKQCTANTNYSNSHGIGSCLPCNECGLKNIIQNCTAYQNRKCGKDCPKGYFLNNNDDCQAEATTEPMGTKPTSTAAHNMTDENLSKTQVYNATAPPAKISSTTPDLENRGLTIPTPPIIANNSPDGKRKEDNGQTVNLQTTFIVVVAILLFAVLVAIVLIFCWAKRSRTESSEFRGRAGENIPLSSRELDSDSSVLQDISVEDVLAKEVAEPKIDVEQIPEDYIVSDMEWLCGHDNQPMLFFVRKALDPIETPTKKTWWSVGLALKVSSADLDLMKIEYIASGSPTERLVEKLKTFSEIPTMREFVQALITCERNDVANCICNWPWEKIKDKKDQP
ncbi:uncharacterized protein LOC144643002 [Oculina patagonica]